MHPKYGVADSERVIALFCILQKSLLEEIVSRFYVLYANTSHWASAGSLRTYPKTVSRMALAAVSSGFRIGSKSLALTAFSHTREMFQHRCILQPRGRHNNCRWRQPPALESKRNDKPGGRHNTVDSVTGGSRHRHFMFRPPGLGTRPTPLAIHRNGLLADK